LSYHEVAEAPIALLATAGSVGRFFRGTDVVSHVATCNTRSASLKKLSFRHPKRLLPKQNLANSGHLLSARMKIVLFGSFQYRLSMTR